MMNLRVILAEQGLLIATHNQGKLKEIQQMLQPLGIACISAADKMLPEPVEDGATFIQNAMIKSRAAAEATKMPSLADDSGLVVPALNGDPGIYSARWAGPDKNFDYAMKSVRIALEAKEKPLDTDAYFVCVLSLALPGNSSIIQCPTVSAEEYGISTTTEGGTNFINVEGRVYGRLSFPPRGDAGFGYDPIFIADGMEQTFAEISADEKRRISHRANAFRGLMRVVEG